MPQVLLAARLMADLVREAASRAPSDQGALLLLATAAAVDQRVALLLDHLPPEHQLAGGLTCLRIDVTFRT